MVDAPKHYTYVPFGIPKLTDKCKELSRLEGVLFYIVSVSWVDTLRSVYIFIDADSWAGCRKTSQ